MTNQFPLTDERFPSYLRLYIDEILELLEENNYDLSWCESLFKDDERKIEYFKHCRSVIRNPVDEFTASNLRGNVLDDLRMAVDGKEDASIIKGYAEEYMLFVVKGLMMKLLHDNKGIEVVNEFIKKRDRKLYERIHLVDCDMNQLGPRMFFEKFCPKSDIKMLDKISACFEPERICEDFKRGAKPYLTVEECKPETATGILKPVDHRLWARRFFQRLPFCTEIDENWYYKFVECCSKDPYNRVMLMFLLPDYKQALKRREDELKAKRNVGGRSGTDDDVVSEDILEMRLQKDYRPFIDEYFQLYIDNIPGKTENCVLRDYQDELAEHALDGKNCIICAPTGAGKTEVCIGISIQHMKKREDERKPFRVVMLVPKVPLVLQQEKRFRRYLTSDKYVVGMSGQDGLTGNRNGIFLAAHVVVMTPQILVDMLRSMKKDSRLYIADISLLIIDEVHHCRKEHAYKVLLSMINDYPHDHIKPQIVGLTASILPTSGSDTNVENSMEFIYRLMANAGATALSVVRRHKQSLEKLVPKPDEEQFPLSRVKNDDFFCGVFDVIRAIYSAIKMDLEKLTQKNEYGVKLTKRDITLFESQREKVLRSGKAGDFKKYKSMKDQIDDQFGIAPEVLQNRVLALHSRLRQVPHSHKMAPMIACEFLDALCHSMQINDLMPTQFAYDYLKTEMNRLKSTYSSNWARDFAKFYEENARIHDSIKNPVEKPIVKKLKEILVEQFDKDPTSQAIIFVNERSTAVKLARFLNDSKVLGGRNDFAHVTSTGQGETNFGMSKEAQRKTIDAFGRKELKCIVSTSVVEEGLDVKACNLIIKYNVASSVVGRIQKAGRARAAGSRSVFLCLDQSVAKAEVEAIIGENHQRYCLEKICSQGVFQLESRIKEEMAKLKNEREKHKLDLKVKQEALKEKKFDVFCGVCHARITCSDSIRRCGLSNFVTIDPDMWLKVQLKVSQKEKTSKYIDILTMVLGELHCMGGMSMETLERFAERGGPTSADLEDNKYCGHPIGKILRYSGTYLPQLQIKEILFRDSEFSDISLTPFKSWKDASENFYIPDANEYDLRSMLNALRDASDLQAKAKLELDIAGDRMLRESARIATNKEFEKRKMMERNTRQQQYRGTVSESNKFKQDDWSDSPSSTDSEQE